MQLDAGSQVDPPPALLTLWRCLLRRGGAGGILTNGRAAWRQELAQQADLLLRCCRSFLFLGARPCGGRRSDWCREAVCRCGGRRSSRRGRGGWAQTEHRRFPSRVRLGTLSHMARRLECLLTCTNLRQVI